MCDRLGPLFNILNIHHSPHLQVAVIEDSSVENFNFLAAVHYEAQCVTRQVVRLGLILRRDQEMPESLRRMFQDPLWH